jgi:hypothetical protein
MAAQPPSSVTRDGHLRVAVALEDWIFQPYLIALLPHADALCKALSACQDSGLSRYTVSAFFGCADLASFPLLKSRAALRADVAWVWPLTYPWAPSWGHQLGTRMIYGGPPILVRRRRCPTRHR